MKLVTIGDSVAQGTMSLATARTELSFSTLLARCLGLRPESDYPISRWGEGGLPINLERVLRRLQRLYGSNIAGPIEWPLALATINHLMDEVEDYYERGPGNIALPQHGAVESFPNMAVSGFTVADAWLVTPRLCLDQIAKGGAAGRDGVFAMPGNPFERTAHAVLNPSRNPAFNDCSQLEWLRRHAAAPDGVETVVLWLGSNNALGTMTRLRIDPTPNTPDRRPHQMNWAERQQFNLWHPDDFAAEYAELMARADAILRTNSYHDWKVFIGTIPPVTVAPLAKGVGTAQRRDDPFDVLRQATYFEYYTYILFDLDFARRTGHRLTGDQAYLIDSHIAQYNESIRRLAQQYNDAHGTTRYVVVEVAEALLQLAYKRNEGNPAYLLPPAVAALNPTPNTVFYYATRRGQLQQGGIFSLDGVHPTAIGQGLLAHEFLKAMTAHGITVRQELDWGAIIAGDTLWTNPIALMPELYDNTKIAEFFLDLLR